MMSVGFLCSLENICEVQIDIEYSDRPNRSYRITGDKITRVIGFKPAISVHESLKNMVDNVVGKQKPTELLNPRYYNINWMCLLNETEKIISKTGSIF